MTDDFTLHRPAWLDEFEKYHNRPMRVLHVGNIANNAYINAKIMRKIGIHADVVCADYYHIMGTPEWEEAQFTGSYGDPFFPDWWRVLRGYQRPSWFYQGPKTMCLDALRAQFEAPAEAGNKRELLGLATHYLAFSESGLNKKNKARLHPARLKRGVDFGLFLLRFSIQKPQMAWEALRIMFPFVETIRAGFNLVFLGLALLATLAANALVRFAQLFRTGQSPLDVQLSLRAAQARWRVKEIFVRNFLAPMLPGGSRVFQKLTGKNFSVVTGWSPSQWATGRHKRFALPSAAGRTGGLQTSAGASEAAGLQKRFSSPATRAAFFAEAQRYSDLVFRHVSWGTRHKNFHPEMSASEYQQDLALGNAMTAGWEDVYRHYDVIQCYSTDGIVPMALGRKNFFNYEHGTLRSIPFEGTSIGRLTASAYRSCTKVMLTNIDNLESCKRLGIPKIRIVPLPHAMDDAKIHRFVAARPSLGPSQHESPLFFSSARQHWLDRDPNYAKGNDIFLRAAANLVHDGRAMRIVLVEWGRDLEASKDLISDLRLSNAVTWVPTMSGEELWERYLRCHAVVDQFVIPAFGRVTFDALTIGRRVISNLDKKLAKEFFGKAPPMLVCSTVKDAQSAIGQVLNDPQDAAGIGVSCAKWAREFHSSQRILDLQLDAYLPSLEIHRLQSAAPA